MRFPKNASPSSPELFVNYYGSSEVYTLSFCDHLDVKPGCAGGRASTRRCASRADPDGSATPDDVVPRGETGEIIASLSSSGGLRRSLAAPGRNGQGAARRLVLHRRSRPF